MLLAAPCLAGLILAYGIIVSIGGVTDLAGAAMALDIAPDIGGSEGVFPPIVILLAQLTVTIFGLVSIFLGFQVCVCFDPAGTNPTQSVSSITPPVEVFEGSIM